MKRIMVCSKCDREMSVGHIIKLCDTTSLVWANAARYHLNDYEGRYTEEFAMSEDGIKLTFGYGKEGEKNLFAWNA